VIRREEAEEPWDAERRVTLDRAVCSEPLAFAADAATYVLIGISIAFLLIMTHSDLAVAAQEMRRSGQPAIR
jgi:hypothetical protein